MAEWLTGSAALDRSDGTSVRRDVGAAAPYHADRDGHYRRGTRFSSARPPATVGRRARNDAGRQRRRIACIRSAGRSAMDTDKSTMARAALRSEEHTSELKSLMRISYAVFCYQKT